jgi:hypothetical protein
VADVHRRELLNRLEQIDRFAEMAQRALDERKPDAAYAALMEVRHLASMAVWSAEKWGVRQAPLPLEEKAA